MGQYLWVEDEFRFAALNRGSDLFDAFAVEAHGRFDRDTGVVVGADNARMIFVDRARIIHRVVDDIIIEFSS